MTLNKARVESPNGEAKLAHSTVLFIGSDAIGRGEDSVLSLVPYVIRERDDNVTSPHDDFLGKASQGEGKLLPTR